MKQLEYIKKVLEFQKTTETSAMYNIVPYPFLHTENYLNDFDIKQCGEILKHIEIVEKFSDKIKNATICFTKQLDGTENLLLVEEKGLNKRRATKGYFKFPECKIDEKYIENDFWNIEFDESKSFHLSVLKNYILELSFENFNKMANYLFNHKLLILENGMFTDPKTIKFQFICWEQIIQFDFDKWLHEVKGFQRFAGVSYDGYLTINNMYDFARWYNEDKLLQEKNNNEFRKQELERVGLVENIQPQPESVFDTNYIPNKEKFKDLPDSNFPTIDTKLVSPEFIINKYYNKIFECSLDAFYAWLVYGKKYEKEQIKWTFKKENSTTVSKAQLKVFIDKITNTNIAKKAYFKNVFDVKIEKSDYKNSFSLDNYFNELTAEIVQNKTNKK